MPGPDVHFLTVNHDKFIPFQEGHEKGSSRNSKQLLGSMSQPRSRPGHPLDLGSLLDQLPPNTGPAGTVSIVGSLGSGSNTNKNLSHVPCKFFRQGNCQAGNSCPFSHNLDGSLAADKLPCKYFQKGNCKFGLKCALAHFLPDGTRVNSKSLNAYRRHDRNNSHSNAQNDNISGSDANNNDHSSSLHQSHKGRASSGTGAGAGSGGNRNSHQNGSSRSFVTLPTERLQGRPRTEHLDFNSNFDANGDVTRSYLIEPVDIRKRSFGEDITLANPSSRNSLLNSSLLTHHLVSQNGTAKPLSWTSPVANYQSLHDWLVAGSAPTNLVSTGTQNGLSSALRSLSSTSPTNLVSLPNSIDFSSNLFSSTRTELPNDNFGFSSRLGLMSKPNNAFLASPSQYQIRPPDELAILDGSREEDAIEDDENAFFEDYVPASLGNLILTPQELQRRDSRSQSGTLWVRPNIGRSPSESKRGYGAGNDNDVFLMD